MTTGSQTGSLAALDAEEPYPGVRRVGFSSGRATVNRYSFEPGASFPLHRHPQEQITLVEQGRVTVSVGEASTDLGPDEYAIFEPGIEHGIRAGDQGARILAVVVPRRAAPDDYELSEGGR